MKVETLVDQLVGKIDSWSQKRDSTLATGQEALKPLRAYVQSVSEALKRRDVSVLSEESESVNPGHSYVYQVSVGGRILNFARHEDYPDKVWMPEGTYNALVDHLPGSVLTRRVHSSTNGLARSGDRGLSIDELDMVIYALHQTVEKAALAKLK